MSSEEIPGKLIVKDGESPLCHLCSLPVSSSSISSGDRLFCCFGCQTVYQILDSASALDQFEKHPIFQQAIQFGLISNPQLLNQTKRAGHQDLEKRKWQVEITDMWCSSCADLIKLFLMKLKGVSHCLVDYATDLAVIEFYPQIISKEEINNLVHSLGYGLKELSDAFSKEVPRQLYDRFLVAAFCAFNVMMFAYPLYAIYLNMAQDAKGELFTIISLLFSLPVITYSAYPIYKRFYYGARVGIIGMEALVSIGVFSALLFSIYEMIIGSIDVYFDSMTVIVAFVLLGKIMEAKAKFSSKETLFRLNRSLPQKVRKYQGDKSFFVSTKEIQRGDLIVAHTGEKIVFDGIVYSGKGASDESMVTGESIPILKNIHDHVAAGTILQSGSIVYRVVKLAKESSIQKIITLIEQEIGSKESSFHFGDQIARYFVPLSLFLSLMAFVLYGLNKESALIALSTLLISCPCALGIAAPLAESHLMIKLAHLGVIVRNRAALRFLGQETIYVFDKTGTVTEGKFSLLRGLEQLSSYYQSVLKTMTSHSAHPLSSAIFQSLQGDELAYDRIEEVPGKGMIAHLNEQCYVMGSPRFFTEKGINYPKGLEGETLVLFAENDRLLTVLSLGDRIKDEARQLRNLFCDKPLVLLSGDHSVVVERVARELRFDEWQAEVTPFEKKDYIEKLKKAGHVVLMIGDGINDAPALTTAHLGVSLISAADISIQVSDFLLTKLSLNQLPAFLMLGKRGQKILKQNFFWAFFYNFIGIGLALSNLLTPLFSAIAMTLSSLIVLFNSKRIGGKDTI
ncbi:MAG: heavy metal translocating P-type ATPase [Parachlamydiaceae bacterium]